MSMIQDEAVSLRLPRFVGALRANPLTTLKQHFMVGK